ncbi:MAG: xanthine dehydrogenase molybdopterin binding subunit, partial [Pusillimonas sp.]
TSEELFWDEKGRLMTHSPSTYKIPSVSDCPESLHVEFFDNGNTENNIFQSKAVGEPPLPTAVSVFMAIRDAIAATAVPGVTVPLDAPATPERVLWAIEAVNEGSVLGADIAAEDVLADATEGMVAPVMGVAGPGPGYV